MARKPFSARFRFSIFTRDDFRCQYCGRRAPNVVLEVDHEVPVSRGGSDHESNLKTACKDCNAGKSAMLLPAARPLLDACVRCSRGMLALEGIGDACADCLADDMWGPAYLAWRKRFLNRRSA